MLEIPFESINFSCDNHLLNIQKKLIDNFKDDSFTDVAIYCDEGRIRAHRIMLAASSDYFCNIFMENPSNAIVLLHGVKLVHAEHIIEYIYQGKTKVKKDDANSFLSIANTLKIKGLMEYGKTCLRKSKQAKYNESALIETYELSDDSGESDHDSTPQSIDKNLVEKGNNNTKETEKPMDTESSNKVSTTTLITTPDRDKELQNIKANLPAKSSPTPENKTLNTELQSKVKSTSQKKVLQCHNIDGKLQEAKLTSEKKAINVDIERNSAKVNPKLDNNSIIDGSTTNDIINTKPVEELKKINLKTKSIKSNIKKSSFKFGLRRSVCQHCFVNKRNDDKKLCTFCKIFYHTACYDKHVCKLQGPPLKTILKVPSKNIKFAEPIQSYLDPMDEGPSTSRVTKRSSSELNPETAADDTTGKTKCSFCKLEVTKTKTCPFCTKDFHQNCIKLHVCLVQEGSDDKTSSEIEEPPQKTVKFANPIETVQRFTMRWNDDTINEDNVFTIGTTTNEKNSSNIQNLHVKPAPRALPKPVQISLLKPLIIINSQSIPTLPQSPLSEPIQISLVSPLIQPLPQPPLPVQTLNKPSSEQISSNQSSTVDSSSEQPLRVQPHPPTPVQTSSQQPLPLQTNLPAPVLKQKTRPSILKRRSPLLKPKIPTNLEISKTVNTTDTILDLDLKAFKIFSFDYKSKYKSDLDDDASLSLQKLHSLWKSLRATPKSTYYDVAIRLDKKEVDLDYKLTDRNKIIYDMKTIDAIKTIGDSKLVSLPNGKEVVGEDISTKFGHEGAPQSSKTTNVAINKISDSKLIKVFLPSGQEFVREDSTKFFHDGPSQDPKMDQIEKEEEEIDIMNT